MAERERVRCEHCGMEFPAREELEEHRRRMHEGMKVPR